MLDKFYHVPFGAFHDYLIPFFQFKTYSTRIMSQDLYQYTQQLVAASEYQNILEECAKSQGKVCSLSSNDTLQTPVKTATDFSL